MVPAWLSACQWTRQPRADLSIGVEKVNMPHPSILTIGRALSSETRVFVLQVAGAEGMDVTRIAAAAGISTGTACFHLALLVQAGLLVRRRRGRRSVYSWGPTRCSIRFEPPATAHTGADGGRVQAGEQ